MEKPITVLRQEFIEKIVEDVNTSELPLFIVEPIIKNLLDSVRQGAENQIQKELAAYREGLERETREVSAQKAQAAACNAGSAATEG